MPTVQKETLVEEIKTRLTSVEGLIMVDYRGLTVKEMQELRGKVRDSGAEICVYKNRLTQIALRELAMPSLDEYLTGPTAFVFAGADAVAPAKALQDFSKAHPALEIKGGLVQNQVVDAAAVKMIASLPSREELVAKLMGVLLNPVRGFMGMANAPVSAFARAVQAVADQKAAA
jgi:large subunit ribosomal protein L10